jgi:hypothetical protein
MMASLLMGKAFGSVEKMDDEFELERMGNNPLLLDLDGPEIWGRRASVATVSTGGTSEVDALGKNERCEAGTLRISGVDSRDVVDDDEPVSWTSVGASKLSFLNFLALSTGMFSVFRR